MTDDMKCSKCGERIGTIPADCRVESGIEVCNQALRVANQARRDMCACVLEGLIESIDEPSDPETVKILEDALDQIAPPERSVEFRGENGDDASVYVNPEQVAKVEPGEDGTTRIVLDRRTVLVREDIRGVVAKLKRAGARIPGTPASKP